MSIPSAKKSSRGRPTVDTEAVNVRLERAALGKLDDWRRGQDDVPTRPEAIRRLIEAGLGKVGTNAWDDYAAGQTELRDMIEALRTGRVSPARGQTRVDGDVEAAIAEAERQIAVLKQAQQILADGAAKALGKLPSRG